MLNNDKIRVANGIQTLYCLSSGLIKEIKAQVSMSVFAAPQIKVVSFV